MLKTASEWQEIYGIIVRDPDGWRTADAPSWDTPISRTEWQKRMGISTIQVVDRNKFLEQQR
jgi:hypothetical protein